VDVHATLPCCVGFTISLNAHLLIRVFSHLHSPTDRRCYAQTMSDFATDLALLAVDYVDLILLHGPSHRGAGSCDENVCDEDLGQWQAYEEMYAKGKAKAIGVSNYCQSCFKCLLNSANVTPAVNQSELLRTKALLVLLCACARVRMHV
jgi:diketogulonate reductase-like aldo/keto reductase